MQTAIGRADAQHGGEGVRKINSIFTDQLGMFLSF